MVIWLLFPQYIIYAFTIVGLQELFYAQMLEVMRSVRVAAYLNALGVGSFLCNAIISIVQAINSRGGEKWLGHNLNCAHLDYFYWVLAGQSAFNLSVHVWNALCFVYKFSQLTEIIS
jgi:peptide/histidine transporter 3/4